MSRGVIAASLVINTLALVMPLVVLQVFDRVIPFESYATLNLLFIGLCIVAFVDFLLKWSRIVLIGHQAERFELRLGDAFIHRSLQAEPTAYDRSSTGAHLERLNALSQLRDYYSGQGRLLAIDLPFTAIFITMIALIGGWLVLVPLVSLALIYGFKTVLQRAQGPIFERRKTLDGRRYSFLIECLSQITTVKSDTMEPQLLRRYEVLQEQSVDISQKLVQFSGLSQSFGALFSQAAVAAMGLAGGYLVITGSIGVAELAACMLLNGRTVQPLLKMLSHWAQTESVQAAQSKVEEIAALEQRQTPNTPFELEGHLKFDSVSVKSTEDGHFFFSDACFDLPKGHILSVLAEEHAARDRFMRLILAEEQPCSGDILLDESPIANFSEMRGPDTITYVDHNPVLFSGTLLENMTCFGDSETIERALFYSAEMGLESKAHRMPMGYNTVLGSADEISSSLALRQTVALVRALALRPKLLLLNDATSALDENAVVRFSKILKKLRGETTVVMVTQRQELLNLADQSVLLADGKADDLLLWHEDAALDFEEANSYGRQSA